MIKNVLVPLVGDFVNKDNLKTDNPTTAYCAPYFARSVIVELDLIDLLLCESLMQRLEVLFINS